MVAGTAADGNANAFYVPFHSYPYPDNDAAPQSSEDGSGIHSPTFIEPDPSSMDPRRHSFRPPPPDLDIRTVESLIADRFQVPHPDHPNAYVHQQQQQHAYGYPPPPGGELHYPSYMHHHPGHHPSHHVFESERRYATGPVTIPREDDGLFPPPRSGSKGGGPGPLDTGIPRPLTIPSLLPSPTSGLPPPHGNGNHAAEFHHHHHGHGGIPPPELTSPISANPISASGARSPGVAQSGSQLQHQHQQQSADRRQPSLVVIACRQCRARKIRCDSTRPACNNCVRRQNDCQYDAVPKRRGPDKRPGTRQRSCKKRPPPSASAPNTDGGSTPAAPPPAKRKKKSVPGGDSGNSDANQTTVAASPTSATAIKSEDGGFGRDSEGGQHLGYSFSSPRSDMSDQSASMKGTSNNMGLRLDMNFTGNGNGSSHNNGANLDTTSSSSHSSSSLARTHSTAHSSSQSSHLHLHPHASGGGVSPPNTTITSAATTNMSFSAAALSSTEMTRFPHPHPKSSSPFRYGNTVNGNMNDNDPFSKYELSSSSLSSGSADSLSDSELSLNVGLHLSGRSFARQLNLNASPPSPPPSLPHPHPSLYTGTPAALTTHTQLYLPSPPPSASTDYNCNKLWWDTLLREYSPSSPSGSSPEQSETSIINDLTSLFDSSIHWLSFLNEKYFFRRLLDPNEREKMQPALVLSALALATLLQSSEIERGEVGRQRALWLRGAAQSHLEAAFSAGNVVCGDPDPALAQAALILATFESSAHPLHSEERVCASLILLDQIIRALALTAIDLADPNACHVNFKLPGSSVPSSVSLREEERCYCAPPVHSPQVDLGRGRGGGGRLSPTWSTSLSWDPAWSVEEIEREQTRRVCWAALSLSVDHAVQSSALHKEPLDLFISRPENYALLFPGEKSSSADRDSVNGHDGYWSPKQSVWALYCRSMLLWNSSLHLRKLASDADKAEFAVNAWLEAADVEDALDVHEQCETTQSHLMYMTREHIFNTRIAVSFEFRRLQNVDAGTTMPKFNRRQAEDWTYYQTQTANRFRAVLHDGRDPLARILARRPFYVWWFMSQLAISMSLWVYDNTLVEALELCKSFLVPLNMLSALWPCIAQRQQYNVLWKELDAHCRKADVPLPSRPVYSLPHSLYF